MQHTVFSVCVSWTCWLATSVKTRMCGRDTEGPWLGRAELKAPVVFMLLFIWGTSCLRVQFCLSNWLPGRWSPLWLAEFTVAFTAHECCMRTAQHLFFSLHLLHLLAPRVITVTFYWHSFPGNDVMDLSLCSGNVGKTFREVFFFAPGTA